MGTWVEVTTKSLKQTIRLPLWQLGRVSFMVLGVECGGRSSAGRSASPSQIPWWQLGHCSYLCYCLERVCALCSSEQHWAALVTHSSAASTQRRLTWWVSDLAWRLAVNGYLSSTGTVKLLAEAGMNPHHSFTYFLLLCGSWTGSVTDLVTTFTSAYVSGLLPPWSLLACSRARDGSLKLARLLQLGTWC